ncbi:MAG: glycoside hydrolase family 31 protein [Kofleriaceae bacterium]
MQAAHAQLRRPALLIAVTLASACGGGGDPVPFPEGATLARGGYAVDVAPDGHGLTLRRGDDAILSLPPGALVLGTVDALDGTLSYDPMALAQPGANVPASLRWQVVESAVIQAVSDDAVDVALRFDGGAVATLAVTAAADGRFAAQLTPTADTAPHVAWMRLALAVSPTEGFYGLGEWADAVEHRGRLRPMQLRADTTLESASNENHVPVPLLIGTRGWGVFVESDRVGLFDVATTADDRVEITYGTADASADGLRFHLLAAPHPLDVTRRYYDLTGDPAVPAPWALGPLIWRDENQDQAEVEADIATIRDLDLATSGIWLDRPYATGVNTFDFDATRFPDPPAMLAAAHAAGLRVALWHTPYLGTDAPTLRAEAEAAGYFPPTTGLLLNTWSAPIDLTNPAAYAWWQAHVRAYTDLGIEGFKLDYAEDVLPSVGDGRNVWRFADGRDERTMHHHYTLLYHRVYAETLPADGGLVLARAGRWGDQVNVSVIWPGDMDANFARQGDEFTVGGEGYVGVGGLPATVIQGLSLGPSGFPFYGADTGGYRHSPPDKETYVRWFQQTALSAVMQVGDSSSEPPWEFTTANGRDEETLGWYRTYARLHLRLLPLLWTAAQRLAVDGRPITRAFGLQHPELGLHPDDVYFLGDDLLVAPVVDAGVTSRTVRLPPGTWTDWWTGTTYPGDADATVPAPLSTLPLLLREGAIVPLLRPTIDTAAPTTLPGVESYADEPGELWLRLVPGPTTTTATLFDDTVIERADRQITLSPGTTFTSGYRLEVLRAGAVAAVTVGGVALPEVALGDLDGVATGWAVDGDTLWIKVAAAGGVVAIA